MGFRGRFLGVKFSHDRQPRQSAPSSQKTHVCAVFFSVFVNVPKVNLETKSAATELHNVAPGHQTLPVQFLCRQWFWSGCSTLFGWKTGPQHDINTNGWGRIGIDRLFTLCVCATDTIIIRTICWSGTSSFGTKGKGLVSLQRRIQTPTRVLSHQKITRRNRLLQYVSRL